MGKNRAERFVLGSDHMDWKKDVTKAIDQTDRAQILQLADKSLNKTLRYVQMNIWGDDRQIRRWHAIEALGWLSQRFGAENDEPFRNLIRRCLWAMNDESGNVPWAAPEVMAAIIGGAKRQFTEYIPMLVTNALDNPMCHQGLAWSIGHLAAEYRQDLAPFLPKLRSLLRSDDDAIRGYAVYAFGLLDDEEAYDMIQGLTMDPAICLHYHDGVLREMTIGQLSALAMERQPCYNEVK